MRQKIVGSVGNKIDEGTGNNFSLHLSPKFIYINSMHCGVVSSSS